MGGLGGSAFPPHSRGWTHQAVQLATDDVVSPALAGMDPVRAAPSESPHGFPRTRGDGPRACLSRVQAPAFPPHSRGWTVHRHPHVHGDRVSPALAGMDPIRTGIESVTNGFPRTRGDGPREPLGPGKARLFPPHSRGWTGQVLRRGQPGCVSPALAGMDPRSLPFVGMASCFPRTRGDGPGAERRTENRTRFPPHSRGWTQPGPPQWSSIHVSPALAGMDLGAPAPLVVLRRFPRTRGDGPSPSSPPSSRVAFPPHSRGWTSGAGKGPRTEPVSPALAGMDPQSQVMVIIGTRFPRTRGDGPVER